MSETPEIKPQPADRDVAGDIVFFADSQRFCIEGLKELRNHLFSFQDVKKTFDLTDSEYDRLIGYIDGMIAWTEKSLASVTGSHPIYEHGVSFGSLRLLKAGGLYRIHQLEERRDSILEKRPDLPRALLAAIDENLAQYRNWLEQGVMNGLKPAEIFFEATRQTSGEIPYKPMETPKAETIAQVSIPPYLERIPVFDGALRKRCLPLLSSLDHPTRDEDSKQNDMRLDTVVREMSVILEDRIRKLAGLEEERVEGQDLMSRAFSGPTPPLRFSSDAAIQQSAHLLYRGYSGFVRNEVMHKLVHTFTRERVLQLLGLVDYLLFVLTQAEHFAGSDAKGPADSPSRT